MSYNYLNLSKTMKTIQKTMGWLVMAAALTIGTTACSNEDMVAENNEPAVMQQAQQKVHITVGAGVGNSEEMRSAVDYNSGTKERTLKFTEGDKLYVRAAIEEEHDDNYDGTDPDSKHESKIMAGFLTIDPATISADGKSAQFTGDLDIYVGTVEPVYEQNWVVDVDGYWDDVNETWVDEVGHDEYNLVGYNLVFSSGTYTFLTADPLAECIYADATLVHAGSETKYTVNDNFKYLNYNSFVASSVNDLMTSSYCVGGGYDKDNHSFGLWSNSWLSAILNCTISGLTPDASYTVRLNSGDTEDYNDHQDYEGNVTANGEGKATFAITAPTADYYFQLALSSTADRKVVTLGRKELTKKVYNITTTATDYVFPAGAPVVSGTTAWPQEVWGGSYWYEIKENPADVSISGSFTGYSFDLMNGGAVSLNNVTASLDNAQIIYGRSSERDLTVVLTGNNSLSSREINFALGNDKGIKLSCTGSSATLTVTAMYYSVYGFNCTNYNGDDPNDLAADGYTVALTETVNGPDSDSDGNPDYISWTYTVTKN